ncbi:MAG: AraC family transcriptional regulator [Faecalicoccus sp.]|nr:AraC family transcriptional regulator [Faecalicoccus sp.]
MHEISFHIFPNHNFMDLGLYQFGQEQCEPGHSFGPAKRNHYLFHYIIAGNGTLLSTDLHNNTTTYHLHSGEGFLIYPNQTNTYLADYNVPWQYAWLEFDGLRVQQALESAGFSYNQPIYRPKSIELSELMQNEMLYIISHNDESSFHLIGHLYLFLDYLTRSAVGSRNLQGNKLRDFYIRETIAYIENNYQNDITIEDIAESIGLNRSYFGKIFKMSIGKTPQQFLMNYRMIKAAELLKLTTLPIQEIGVAVGYPNQMHFSRAFKQIHNVSPRQFRSHNRIEGVDAFSNTD